jgi:peptidoglycan/LPS O-acetylase OafA/YrhL
VSSDVAPRSDTDFPCIDGLRAFAAVSVVLCHTAGVSSLISTTPGAYLAGLRAGVQIFFVISGFVLYRPFAQAHRLRQRGPGLGGYFRRRFLRIFPAYWLVLTVGVYALGVIYLFGTTSTVSNYLLVQTYVRQPLFFAGLGPAWTLVAEVSFYVFLPFYAFAVWRVGRRHMLATELVGCATLFGVGIACGAWNAFGTAPLYIQALPANFIPFALGMVLAVAKVSITPHSRTWHMSERAFARPSLPWLVAILAFSATIWAVHYPAVAGFATLPGHTQMAYELLTDAMGLFVVLPVVFGNQSRGAGRRVLRTRPIVFLGAISYGIYLWHVPMIDETIKAHLFGPSDSGPPRYNFFAVTAVAVVLSVIVAAASWFILEKPLISLSRRPSVFPRIRTRSATVPPVVAPAADALVIDTPMVDAYPAVVAIGAQQALESPLNVANRPNEFGHTSLDPTVAPKASLPPLVPDEAFSRSCPPR